MKCIQAIELTLLGNQISHDFADICYHKKKSNIQELERVDIGFVWMCGI